MLEYDIYMLGSSGNRLRPTVVGKCKDDADALMSGVKLSSPPEGAEVRQLSPLVCRLPPRPDRMLAP